jgi:putative hemolysin
VIFGELVPKSLALKKPEAISAVVSGPMSFLARIGAPLIHIMTWSTDFVLKLLGGSKENKDSTVSEQEIRMLVRQAHLTGTLEPGEKEIVDRVIQLGERTAASIMTRRTDIEWVNLSDSPEKTKQMLTSSRHDLFPVGIGRLTQFQGIVYARDLMTQCFQRKEFDVLSILKQPLIVLENSSILNLLEQYRKVGEQFAIVVDEYGSITGIVTQNDVLQGIIGKIPEEGPAEEPSIVQRSDGSWSVDGMLSIYEFISALQLEESLEDEEGNYHTVAGLVLAHMRRIPTVGDVVEIKNLRFEIADMDGKRIDRLLVSFPSKARSKEDPENSS